MLLSAWRLLLKSIVLRCWITFKYFRVSKLLEQLRFLSNAVNRLFSWALCFLIVYLANWFTFWLISLIRHSFERSHYCIQITFAFIVMLVHLIQGKRLTNLWILLLKSTNTWYLWRTWTASIHWTLFALFVLLNS